MTNQDLGIRPGVDQWSNGVNQADELNRIMQIRRAALNRLCEHTIRTGAPMATIEEPLVPIFMYHRYSVESAASGIGGQVYIYGMRGDGRTPVKWESAANQRKALEALANTPIYKGASNTSQLLSSLSTVRRDFAPTNITPRASRFHRAKAAVSPSELETNTPLRRPSMAPLYGA